MSNVENKENITNEYIKELAEHIYDFDAKVYETLGSSLGRVFSNDRDKSVEGIEKLLRLRKKGHTMRSELALISNMARTIEDDDVRREIMIEYNEILTQVIQLPTSFGGGDILDIEHSKIETLNLRKRFSKDDHVIICIGRTYGSGGSEIGFQLADTLKMNYYDAEIFDEVMKRLEVGADVIEDNGGFPYVKSENNQFEYKEKSFVAAKRTIAEKFSDFNKYHGLSKKDAVFFNSCDLIVEKAKQEDCIIMGRCADAILTNNNIPHINIFINASLPIRMKRILGMNPGMTEKQVLKMLTKYDKEHHRYYKYFTGHSWGKTSNYDLCINSGSYGIEGSIEMILRMIDRTDAVDRIEF